ncbi:MAG: dihydrodipicolinate synthase family protein [Devosia sp.]|nr:dihydrodipicolinate synthase family protein [Devosia sp.]
MSLPPLHGVVPILLTPFHNDGRLDEESLASLVEFNIAVGVHGLGVALGSEIFKFNEAERAQVTRCVVAAARRRVPIVINTGAAGTDLAIHYSRLAEAAGADALMVIPPTFARQRRGNLRLLRVDRQAGRHPDHPAGRAAGSDFTGPGVEACRCLPQRPLHQGRDAAGDQQGGGDVGRGRRSTDHLRWSRRKLLH